MADEAIAERPFYELAAILIATAAYGALIGYALTTAPWTSLRTDAYALAGWVLLYFLIPILIAFLSNRLYRLATHRRKKRWRPGSL